MPINLSPAPAAPGTPTSIYHTYEEFVRRWGEENIAVASNKDNNNSSTPDLDAVQDSFNWAVGEIAAYFLGGPYAIPFVFAVGVPTPVSDWALTLAFSHLYTARGLEDKAMDKVGNKYERMRHGVYTDMGFYKSGIKQLPATLATDTGTNLAHAEPTPLYGTCDARPVDGVSVIILE